MNTLSNNKYLTTKNCIICALLAAILLVSQIAIAFLPNIELVSFLIILYALVFRWRVFPVIYIFAFLEAFIYGFGIWVINYFYVWTVLAILVFMFQKFKTVLFWSIFSALFGLSFGTLCAIPYFFIGGLKMAFSYFLSGIPFDIIHCCGNFIIMLILYKPILNLLHNIKKRI